MAILFLIVTVSLTRQLSEQTHNGGKDGPVSPQQAVYSNTMRRKALRKNTHGHHDKGESLQPPDGPSSSLNTLIPHNLVFTHYINLLTAPSDQVHDEDVALRRNVRNTITLHSDASVHFLTDQECLDSIGRVMGTDSPLLGFFRQETHGMYKADICRGAALYELGGYYMDVDIQARLNVMDVIRTNTTFCTVMVHRDSNHRGNFFQAFIASTPRNPILKRYLELFEMHYHGLLDIHGPLGVILLRKAHDDVVGTPRHPKPYEQHGQQVELWGEVRYSRELFPDVPPPIWGERRACHFVVVSDPKPPCVVPFYSRTKGSRMCGGSESTKT